MDGTTPGNNDSAKFNLPGTYTVSFNADPDTIFALSVENAANVTFASSTRPQNPFQARTLQVRNAHVGGNATLTLGTFSAGSIPSIRPFHLITASDDLDGLRLGAGTLNVKFNSSIMTPFIRVGLGPGGQSTMAVTDGAVVTSSFGGRIGDQGSNAAVTISGPGSRWVSFGDLSIAESSIPEFGNSTLVISEGGLVENVDAIVGQSGAATVTIVGDGSMWNSNGAMEIGGFGTVQIQPGGTARVGLDTLVRPGAHLRLQGGTFDTEEFAGADNFQFEWTAGTLHVGTYHGNLEQPVGILAPGHSAGSTNILGQYTQQSAGALEIEIGGIIQRTQYDVVNVTGNVLLGGRLDLKLINGFVPTPSQTFVILNTSTSISGAFNNAANGQRLTTADGGGSFLVNYGFDSAFDPTLVVLSSFRSGGLSADFDEDGDVDGADLVKWKAGFGTMGAATHMQGDANADGRVDGADFLTWQQQLGSAATMAASSAVPEPATLLSLISGALAMSFRRCAAVS